MSFMASYLKLHMTDLAICPLFLGRFSYREGYIRHAGGSFQQQAENQQEGPVTPNKCVPNQNRGREQDEKILANISNSYSDGAGDHFSPCAGESRQDPLFAL